MLSIRLVGGELGTAAKTRHGTARPLGGVEPHEHRASIEGRARRTRRLLRLSVGIERKIYSPI